MAIEHLGEKRSNAIRRMIERARARGAPHLHAHAADDRQERRRLPLDLRRPQAVRLHVGRARRQSRPQPGRMAAEIPGLHGLARDAHGAWLLRIGSSDRLQRDRRDRGGRRPAARDEPAVPAGRTAARTGHVGGVRLRGGPEGALGLARGRPRARSHSRDARRLSRQEGTRRSRHRERDRQEPRSARALHLLSEGGVPRRLASRCAVRLGAVPRGARRHQGRAVAASRA